MFEQPLGLGSPAAAEPRETVPVPAGTFRFGPRGESRTGRAFRIDEHPVTNAEFARFLEQTGYRPEDPRGFLRHWHQGRHPAALSEHPVVYVAFEDAAAYASWAGGRLPTWEEWEQAARGGTGGPFPWGERFDLARCNVKESGLGGTTPVRAYPTGAATCGALDMLGNVWEWTETWRTESGRRTRILLGGSWATPMASTGLSRVRDALPDTRDFQTGFRCVYRE